MACFICRRPLRADLVGPIAATALRHKRTEPEDFQQPSFGRDPPPYGDPDTNEGER